MYCTNKTHAVVDSTVMGLSLYAAKDTGNVTGVCTLSDWTPTPQSSPAGSV